MPEPILTLTNIFKKFQLGTQEVEIIKGVTFTVNEGEFVILFGPSGCGKSTVLNILLGLEPPTTGEVYFQGKQLYDLDDDGRAQLRKQKVGVVYQQSNWVKSLNVLENIYFPLTLRGIIHEERERKAWEMLKLVDLEQTAHQIPSELSSGQQQRISLARALISNPVLIVADEPTGNLDSKASQDVMQLFKSLNQEGKTVVMVTHDLEYLSYATSSINLSDGVIIGQYKAGDKKLRGLSLSKRGQSPMVNTPTQNKKLTKEKSEKN